MTSLRRLRFLIPAMAFASVSAFGQSAISARSGMIHYVEGRVFLGAQQVDTKIGNFPQVKENEQLKTEQGRAEVLLTPGVFLRLGENSAFRMITNRLIDTRLEFLSGSMILEVDDILKDNSVTIVDKDATIHLQKKGLYRFDSEPAQLRVYDGEVAVVSGDKTIEVKEGKALSLDGEMAVTKFDKETGDALNRWSRRRGEYVAMANVSAAKSIRDSGLSWNSSSWAYNPYFGMFTFIPMRGAYYSPYGYAFWSPFQVYQVYAPRPVYMGGFGGSPYNSSLGYSTVPHTSSGYSGTIARSASVAAPAAAAPASSGVSAAPVSRGGGSAGGGRR
ncbi:MAG: hypothetical protein M1436_07760 [Acidobacteria bacterium]|nr:hypothetical protein [Acidobacteriota bacterium]